MVSLWCNQIHLQGRVERANLTLEVRLLKEMHLEGISNIEEGNPPRGASLAAQFTFRIFSHIHGKT